MSTEKTPNIGTTKLAKTVKNPKMCVQNVCTMCVQNVCTSVYKMGIFGGFSSKK